MLLRAYRSVLAQILPNNWSLEWIVQADGDVPVLSDFLPMDDRRISYSYNGQHSGTAITRNLALSRASGKYVRVLDDDDELLPGAIAQDIRILEDNPGVAWTTSRAIDKLPDGTEFLPNQILPAGKIPIGGMFDIWIQSDGVPPVHPATLCARIEVIRAFGGWMALPVSDDVGLLMAMSLLLPGYFAPLVSMQYNKSDIQITSSEYSKSKRSKEQRMTAIRQRVESMSELRELFVPQKETR